MQKTNYPFFDKNFLFDLEKFKLFFKKILNDFEKIQKEKIDGISDLKNNEVLNKDFVIFYNQNPELSEFLLSKITDKKKFAILKTFFDCMDYLIPILDLNSGILKQIKIEKKYIDKLKKLFIEIQKQNF